MEIMLLSQPKGKHFTQDIYIIATHEMSYRPVFLMKKECVDM